MKIDTKELRKEFEEWMSKSTAEDWGEAVSDAFYSAYERGYVRACEEVVKELHSEAWRLAEVDISDSDAKGG